jgi:hypothetical protein
MKANKLFRISEIMWLVIAIVCILTDIYIFLVVRDNQKGVFFLGMTMMAVLMFIVRRRMRIRADNSLEQEGDALKGTGKKKKN